MPTIRVDDAVYGALQKRAVPFVDTPNSVLRRMLSLEADVTAATTVANRTDQVSAATTNATYHINTKGVSARAVRTGAKGMRLMSATTPLKEMESLSDSNRDIRRRLLKDGYFTQEASGRYKLTRPFDFASPSAASSVLLGHESNGRLEWKDSNGEALGSR